MTNKKSSTAKQPSCISLSPGIKKRLKYQSARTGEPASHIVEKSLKSYLKRK